MEEKQTEELSLLFWNFRKKNLSELSIHEKVKLQILSHAGTKFLVSLHLT